MLKDLSIEKKVLRSIEVSLKTNGKCTFTQLVKEAFILYPNDFSLSDYPQWPDTLKLDRPLRKLREDGLISGSTASEFLLTTKGEKAISEIKSFEAKSQLMIDFKKKK
jgi:hypothetical protein